MRILMILIGEEQFDAILVIHFERFLESYYLFLDSGFDVVLATPMGGDPALRTASGQRTDASPVMARLRHDPASRDALADTLEIARVEPGDFDGAFCLGVSDRIWPPNEDNPAGVIIDGLLAAGKPVAVVPIGLDLEPRGTAGGILIGGDRKLAPILVAKALIGSLVMTHC
jgi:hypothetical protein